jgi:hypothetical protein
MNKRQRKKREKKYLPVIADEVNLLTMTDRELEKAIADFKRFKERYAYRKKYRDLKNGKPLMYYFPAGESYTNFMKELNHKARTSRTTTVSVTQSLSDFLPDKSEQNKKLAIKKENYAEYEKTIKALGVDVEVID